MVALSAAAATSPWWVQPAANTLGIGGMMLWNYLNKNNFLPTVPTQDLFPSNQPIEWRNPVTDSNLNVIAQPSTVDKSATEKAIASEDVPLAVPSVTDIASPPPPNPKESKFDPGETARIDALFRAKQSISPDQQSNIDPATLAPTQKSLEQYGFNTDEYELVPGADGNYKVVKKAVPPVGVNQGRGSIPPDGIGTKDSPFIAQVGDPRFTTGSGTKDDPYITRDTRAWEIYQKSLPPSARSSVETATPSSSEAATKSRKTRAIVDAFLETMDILGY